MPRDPNDCQEGGLTRRRRELLRTALRVSGEFALFGLVFGFIPLAHYMHGSMEEVGEAFLKYVTLWWGCAFALAVDVAQIGGLAMISIGLAMWSFVAIRLSTYQPRGTAFGEAFAALRRVKPVEASPRRILC